MVLNTFLFLLASSCVTFASLITECPPKESTICECRSYRTGNDFSCFRIGSLKTLQSNLKALRGYSIHSFFVQFVNASTMPTDLFQGLHVRDLHLYGFDVEDDSLSSGRAHFLGLENSLRSLSILHQEKKPFLNLKLDHLHSLEALVLQYSKIPEIGNNWFTNGPRDFRALHAEGNGIEKLGDKAFASLQNLEELKLEKNQLKEISRSMLPFPATKLRSLKLGWNKIRTLPSDIFSEMPSLVGVDLDYNLIHALPEDVWSPVLSNRLYFILLNGNPLRCNEDMKWICEQKTNAWRFDANCDSPVDKRGLSVIDGLCKS